MKLSTQLILNAFREKRRREDETAKADGYTPEQADTPEQIVDRTVSMVIDSPLDNFTSWHIMFLVDELDKAQQIERRLADQIKFVDAVADDSAPPSWDDVRALLKFIKTGEQS